MDKENKIYLIIAAIAFLALNIGLFIFSYQHAIKNFEPDKGTLDPIFFTGMVVHLLGTLATIVFVTFRLKGK